MLRTLSPLVAVAATVCLAARVGLSQDLSDASSSTALQAQVDAQAIEIQELRDRLDRHAAIFETSPDSDSGCCDDGPALRRLPVVVESSPTPSCAATGAPSFHALDFACGYENGFVVRPMAPRKHPFKLRLNGWIQFRHHAFARDVVTWTDNAGVTRPVRSRNAFDIERARLVFSGYAQDERLTYFLQLDGDTDDRHAVDFFDYFWGWQFSEVFQLQLGKRKVPASRQWLLGARLTRFVDRPLATDFFRPDRTVGLFGIGKLGNTGHYEVMVGNGYRTSNIPNAQTDNQFSFAATNYVDPWGDFGRHLVAFDWTCDPLVRLGHSFVFAPQAADAAGVPLEEADFVRLTDGTQLTQLGALAPGVTVSDFDVYFYGVDFAYKWLGWSLNAEAYLRWIQDIRGNGALPVSGLFQRGFYVEGGRFLVANCLDVNVRYSQVSGLFGNASEYAAGFNWYPRGKDATKVSFDVTSLDGSPLQNTASDILVGDDGVLFRTQFQTEF